MGRQEMAPRRILLAAALFGVTACTHPAEIEVPPAPPLVQPAKPKDISPIKPALRELPPPPPTPTPKTPEYPEFRFLEKWTIDFRLQNVDRQGRVISNKDGTPQWKPAESVGANGNKKQLTSEYFLPTTKVVVNPQTNSSEVLFELNDEGSRLLEGISKSNIGQPLGIFVEGRLVALPRISSGIVRVPGKPTQAVISGLRQDDAQRLAERLNMEAMSRILRVLPTKFEITDTIPSGTGRGKVEEGWKWVFVTLGFENVGKDQSDVTPVGFSWDQFKKTKIATREGFQYELYDTGTNDFYCSYVGIERSESVVRRPNETPPQERLLPSGFRIKGIAERSEPKMCFRVAKSTSGYKLQIPGLPEVDLEKEAERVKNLKFPADRPDSDFQEFIDRSFTIPNKGILRITGIERGKDKFILRGNFTNASQGYDRAFYVPFQIFGNDGILYGGGISGEVGPGLSKEVTGNLNIPREISGGKFIATGDIEGVFNLRLSSVQEAKPSILKAGYFERCTDCGANFKVDDLEISQDKLRIPITIKNTGESGGLQFDFSSSSNKVYVFDSAQAAKFKDAFRETNAFRRADLWPILFGAIHPLALIISPEPNTKTPAVLPTGKEWRGFFEAKSDSLPPKDKIAAILVSLNYSSDKLRAAGRYEAVWVSYDDTRPFIEIKR